MSFPLPSLEPWQWAALCFAAFCTGLAKTGLTGVGIISIGLFPMLLPPREAVGSVLLLLIGSDVLGVLIYRRDAEWRYLWKLFPWAGVGVVLGYFAMKHINDLQVKHLIGAILLFLVVFQVVQRLRPKKADAPGGDAAGDTPDLPAPPAPVLSALTGILAGFTTMVANAAGPVMILYLLNMRLPKLAFLGTAAWFFMILNWSKVPFGVSLGTITPASFRLALVLFPAALVGGCLGRPLVQRINQKTFEYIALSFTFLAGLNLLLAHR